MKKPASLTGGGHFQNPNNVKNIPSGANKRKSVFEKLQADCRRLKCGNALLPILEKKIKGGYE